MAKNPKFLKNILTTASTVALVGFSATSAMGDWRLTNNANATATNGINGLIGFTSNDFTAGADCIQLNGPHNVTTSGPLDHSNGVIDINGNANQTFTVEHPVIYGAGLNLNMNLVVNAGSITLQDVDNVTVNGGTVTARDVAGDLTNTTGIVTAHDVAGDLTNTTGIVTAHDVAGDLTNTTGTVTVHSINGTAALNGAGTTKVATNIGALTVQGGHTTEVGKNLHNATFVTDEVIILKGNHDHTIGAVTVIPTGGAGTFIADEMTHAADTLRFTANVGAVGNPLKLIQAKGGGKIKLDGNTYTQKIDVGVSDTTITLTGADHKIEALTHANNAVTLEVDNAAAVLVAGTNISSANNRLKAVKFNDAKTLTLQDGVNIFAINSGNVVDTGITTIRDGSGVLAFVGDSTVDAVFTRPIGYITSDNAAKTVKFIQDVKVSTAAGNTGVIGVGTGGTMQFGSDVTAEALQGKVANQGTAEFNNAQAAKVTMQVEGGGLLALKVSGSDLTFDNKLAKAASYDFGTQSANITVVGDVDIAAATVTTQSNARNQNFIVENNLFVGKAGAADKHFGSFILATANKSLAVTQADFYASVGTNNAGEGTVEFTAVNGKVDNIGTSDKPMKIVNFTQNTTVFGNLYAKEVSIAKAMTGTFHKEVNGGKVTLNMDAISTFKDGSILLSTLNPTTNGNAIANFEGGTTIEQGVASPGKYLAELNFLDNAGKTQALAGNFYAENISLLKTVARADADVVLYGTVTSVDTTYDTGVMKIILNPHFISTFSGDLTFKSTYDGSKNGRFLVQHNALADFTNATKITVELVDESTERPSIDGAKVTILDLDIGEVINFDLAKVQEILPASNKFVTWTFDKPNLTFIINDRTEQGTLEVLQGASDRVQENAKALVNITNTLDAATYGTELFNLGKIDEKSLIKSIERFLSPSTAQASQAVFEATSEARSIITSRMQTLASPRPLQVTSLDGVAAGEQDAVRYGVWGSSFYNQGIQKVRKDVSGYKSKSFGGTVGFDTMANDTMIVGLAATAVKTDLKHRDTNAGDKTKANTVMFSIYGLQQINEDWFLQGVANFGSTRVKNSAKRIGFANGAKTSQTAAAKYDSMSWGGEVVAGYTFKISDLAALTPMLGLDYTRISDSGYTETGTTSQNQIVSKKSMDKINLVAGVRGVLASTNYSGVTITPEAHAFVRQALGNKKAKIDIKLNGMAGTLAPLNIKPAKTLYNVGLGLNAQSGMMDYGLTYDAHLANKYVGHQGTLKVRVKF